MNTITGIKAMEKCGDYGLLVTAFEVTFRESIEELNLQAANIAIEGNVVHPTDKTAGRGVLKAEKEGCVLKLETEPFLYGKGFRVSMVVDGEIFCSFTSENVTEEVTEVVDEFDALVTEKGMPYRLYNPQAEKKLPLIIWFHGNGERGTDNRKPLTAGRGAVCFAEPENQEKHPCLVLVPQMDHDWSDDELQQIADIAAELIREGKADPDRIYAVGLAAMQATLRFSTLHRDLVAAAIPIIYWEKYDIDWMPLRDLPMWCCIAENDITGEAPKMEAFYHRMKDELGNKQIRCTLYTKEEMDALGLYGGLSHWGWVPTVNDPKKIDWLFEQRK